MQEDDKQINKLKDELALFKTVAFTFLAVVLTSSVFFHFIEKWKWLDSFYFTIITISTVGYGNIVPATDIGKIGNIVLIITGIGIFTVFITQLVKRQGLKRLEKKHRINKK
jgi:voltage-gated potassium channel